MVCGKSFGHFLVSQLGKFQHSHHLSKAFPTCFHLTCGENSMVMRGTKVPVDMFEGRNLLNLNLTPVTNTPKILQLHKLCGLVVEPSLPTSVRFFISFLRELCQFA